MEDLNKKISTHYPIETRALNTPHAPLRIRGEAVGPRKATRQKLSAYSNVPNGSLYPKLVDSARAKLYVY